MLKHIRSSFLILTTILNLFYHREEEFQLLSFSGNRVSSLFTINRNCFSFFLFSFHLIAAGNHLGTFTTVFYNIKCTSLWSYTYKAVHQSYIRLFNILHRTLVCFLTNNKFIQRLFSTYRSRAVLMATPKYRLKKYKRHSTNASNTAIKTDTCINHIICRKCSS